MASTNGLLADSRILHVNVGNLGNFKDPKTLERWELPLDTKDLEPLREAAKELREGNTPVGFPTETVYGLGADATRSDAVKGIYKAKGRPSDNPLIIHVCDLAMLRSLLAQTEATNGTATDPIPGIYKPLIEKFWPGPLTILLPNPRPSKLASEVTAGLPTFGARMPNSPLALSLIHLAGVPLAAPSANASTKPSPTTAEHVQHDLNGKINMILDGGPCLVGVESTVVDGMCDPPVVLRPGGVSIDRIRNCEGWSGVVKGYKDASEIGAAAPRAPGMKYKHYSPKAKVVLYEAAANRGDTKTGIPLEVWRIIQAQDKQISHMGYESLVRLPKIGIVGTKNWKDWAGFHNAKWASEDGTRNRCTRVLLKQSLKTSNSFSMQRGELWEGDPKSLFYPEDVANEPILRKELQSYVSEGPDPEEICENPEGVCETLQKSASPENVAPDLIDPSNRKVGRVIEISLGKDTKDIAHGLFSALRELDQRDVDVIYVEGIEDEGDIAAAVMNRLRKAATQIET